MFGLSDSNHTDSSTAFIGAQWARLEPQGDPPNARWGHASLAIAVPLHQSQPQPVLLVVGGFPSVTVEVCLDYSFNISFQSYVVWISF